MKKYFIAAYSILCIGMANVNAQISVIHNFNDTLGRYPIGSLTLSGNRLFGMTSQGGAKDSGCIFSINKNGSGYKDICDFNGKNGAHPIADLVVSGNTLYGMTFEGGANQYGCIFSIDTNGSGYKDLHDFNTSPVYILRPL